MTIERANDLLERIDRLDDATSQYLAFHFLVKDLNDRLPLHFPDPRGQHPKAVANVRAANVRATIAQAVAILDYTGDDKASVGQILQLLRDGPFREFLFATLKNGGDALPDETAYPELITLYESVTSSEEFRLVKRLRNREIGHILMLPNEEVPYPPIFELSEKIRVMLLLLHRMIGRRQPHFVGQIDELQSQAALFWNTYLAGAGIM